MNKICIYAICKNEIKFVDKWLDSMSEADYIVVLDTGSTDGTYKKLKEDSRVTKVIRKPIKPWRFDVARNESMKLVPDDANILFCTDFDEVLEPGWADIIRQNWKETTTRGRYRYVWSHTESGGVGVSYQYDKMHSRDYKWYYPVHEVLGGLTDFHDMDQREVEGSCINFEQVITLHHYPDLTKSRSSYMDLLKLRYEENPDECYSAYLLAREYGVYRQYDEALELLDHVLDMPDTNKSSIIRHASLTIMGDIYKYKQDYISALSCYSTQIITNSSYREPYFGMAEIYNQLGMYSAAVGMVEDALNKTYRHYDWSEKSETWNEQMYDILSVSYYYLDRVDEGIENALRALTISPNNTRIQKNYLALIDKKRLSENK